eukprot:9193734-Prorocentrum_lima.AAC.1
MASFQPYATLTEQHSRHPSNRMQGHQRHMHGILPAAVTPRAWAKRNGQPPSGTSLNPMWGALPPKALRWRHVGMQ